MIRRQIARMLCAGLGLALPPSFAQCTISTSGAALHPDTFFVDLAFPSSLVVGIMSLGGFCPGNTNANVKFKFLDLLPSTNDLVISPSIGTTPATVFIGVDPAAFGSVFTGGTGIPIQVRFTTVDQSPPSTTFGLVKFEFVAPGAPVIQSVVNAASLAPTISPGGLVSISGTNLGPNATATYNQADLYPTTLGQSTVTFNGVAGALVSMSVGQIVAQAPFEIAGQNSVQVVLTRYAGTSSQQTSNTFTVAEADNSLAIFTASPGSGGPPGVENCTALGCTPNSLENPAPAGSIVVFYATSSGFLRNSLPDGTFTHTMPDGSIGLLAQHYSASSLTIGGQPATILYSGNAPLKLWGTVQVNARVPAGLAPGPQPVVLTLGNLSTAGQNVSVVVQ